MRSIFKCLRPKIITNKCGERVTVSCGHCSACLSKKASYNSKLCCLESESNNFTFFITLTYNQESLPVCRVMKYGDTSYLINVTPRLIGTSENDCVGVLNYSVPDNVLSFIFNKVYDESAVTPYEFGEGYIPYVSKVDVQNFMKRLRYYIGQYAENNKLKNEKIRYYIASEYGPEHLRPHYHILLFFNSSWLLEELSGFLHKAWTFGNIDYSQVSSSSGCSSYVASYCNCFAYLPSCYKSLGLRPFCLHSVRFGCKPFEDSTKKILSDGFTEPPVCSVRFGDRVREVFAPLSFSSTFLPRCYHYVQSNDYVRYCLLSVFGRTVARYAIDCPSVSLVASIICYVDSDIKQRLESVLGQELSEENITSIVQSSYNYFRLCKEFPCVDIRKHIDNYYSDYCLHRLSDFYQSQVDFILEYGFSNREFLVHYYDNVYVRGMSSFDSHSLDISDIERSRRFYDSISIAWDFVDISDISYEKNPLYSSTCLMSDMIFNEKSKIKKYNDKFNSKSFCY